MHFKHGGIRIRVLDKSAQKLRLTELSHKNLHFSHSPSMTNRRCGDYGHSGTFDLKLIDSMVLSWHLISCVSVVLPCVYVSLPTVSKCKSRCRIHVTFKYFFFRPACSFIRSHRSSRRCEVTIKRKVENGALNVNDRGNFQIFEQFVHVLRESQGRSWWKKRVVKRKLEANCYRFISQIPNTTIEISRVAN